MAELGNVLALAGSGARPETPVDNLADLARLAGASGMFPSDFDAAQTERLLAVYSQTVRLPLGYRPGPYDGDMLLFAAAEGSDPASLAASWAPFVAGTVTTTPIACAHERMTAPDSSNEIAAILAPLIQSDLPQPEAPQIAAK
jgi:enterobactin synthetase component F